MHFVQCKRIYKTEQISTCEIFSSAMQYVLPVNYVIENGI